VNAVLDTDPEARYFTGADCGLQSYVEDAEIEPDKPARTHRAAPGGLQSPAAVIERQKTTNGKQNL
jgi:hypothetical protein